MVPKEQVFSVSRAFRSHGPWQQSRQKSGEITYLNGAPATGTVVLADKTTYFCIEVGVLRKLVKFNSALHSEIEKSIAEDLRGKLARNARLESDAKAPAFKLGGTARCLI